MAKTEHYIATPRSVRLNNAAWVLWLCTLVASVTVIFMQQGVIADLLSELEGPSSPAPVIRVQSTRSLVCILQPGSSNEAPAYKCIVER